MKTKQNVKLFLSLLTFIPVMVFGQNQQDRKDKIETMHIAYLSQKLNLTSEEAEKFWPIYNEYKADQNELRKQRQNDIRTVRQAGGIDSMKSADVQKLIANETDLETRELDLRKKYLTKFEQVVSVNKVAKFFIAEDEFKRYLLNQLRHKNHSDRDKGNDEQGLN